MTTTNQPANSTPTTNEGAVTQTPSADATKVDDAGGNNLLDNGAPKADDATKVADADKANQGKTDDDAKGDDKSKADDKKADDKSKQTAPEKYEDFKLPEGTEVDTELMGEFTAIAKELNLTQEQAQKLAEIGGKIALKANGPTEKEIVDKAKATWGAEAQADKEIGGDKFVENLGIAKKALDTFGSVEFKNILGDSGFCNHPEMVRFLYKIGKNISEDNVLVTGNRTASPQNHADKLYGATSKSTK